MAVDLDTYDISVILPVRRTAQVTANVNVGPGFCDFRWLWCLRCRPINSRDSFEDSDIIPGWEPGRNK